MIQYISQPEGTPRLGDVLNEELVRRESGWSRLTAAVAFVKGSGVRYVQEALRNFVENGGSVRITVGIDHRGTSIEGLRLLLESVGTHGEVWVFHNEAASTFHPKIYLFENNEEAFFIVGSGNLTAGGLYTNYEAGLSLRLNAATRDGALLLERLHQVFTRWQDDSLGLARRLDEALLEELQKEGYIGPESTTADDMDEGAVVVITSPRKGLFGRVAVPSPPGSARRVLGRRRERRGRTRTTLVGVSFVMTLQRTDVGTGQTTPGASRRSPEIFIPLRARNALPSFWGWDSEFTEDTSHPGKFDRTGVRMRLGVQDVVINMMLWPDKHDFRLRSEPLRSAGNVGDIIRIEFADRTRGFNYLLEVIPHGTRRYDEQLALCTEPVPNSRKRYGYY